MVAAVAATLVVAHVTRATAPYTVSTDSGSYSIQQGDSHDISVTLTTGDGNPLATPADICLASSDGEPLASGLSAGDASLQDNGDSGTITLSVSSGASPGNYTLAPVECGGSVVGDPFTVTVTAVPDYSFDLTDGSDEILAGQSSTVSGTITPTGGFSSGVDVCLFGDNSGSPDLASLPSGVTLHGGQNQAFTSGSYTHDLTIDTTLANGGHTYTLYLGPCNDTSKAQQYSLTVDTPSFQFAPDQSSYEV
ncbi:MAG TPA: hypothetical protein VGU02_15850, partial [Gaiellaceae bacterium]|nr:hypothetical protein [Gaiellaceae bacterium]